MPNIFLFVVGHSRVEGWRCIKGRYIFRLKFDGQSGKGKGRDGQNLGKGREGKGRIHLCVF